MSTPGDPQRTPVDPRSPAGTSGNALPADEARGRSIDGPREADSPPTTRWSDADVLDDRRGQGDTTHLPAVHAGNPGAGDRQPRVEIRNSPPTLATPTAEVDRTLPGAGTGEPVADTDPDLRAQPTAVGVVPDRQTVVAREKERFGGMKFGSAFFGWLTATGLAVLLLAILAAAGVAFGVATDNNVNTAVQQSQDATSTAKTVGLIGAIVLLVILFVAYYCGGYVAGRMARFDGVKQGLGVWIWAIITSAVIAAVAAVAGAKYNVLAQLNLPRIPVDEGSVTTVGIIAIVAAIVVALLGALLGGAVGTRYHRKVDAVGFDEAGR